MFAFISHLFVLLIYQPFLNVLVFAYWATGLGSNEYNMGLAVIALTIVIRLCMLPLSLNGMKTEHKRYKVMGEMRELESELSHDPVALTAKKKQVMRSNKNLVASEIINMIIQVMIAIMLWRLFSTGLSGEDTHLIYSWMPYVPQPFDLIWWGIDLTQPNMLLNLLQCILLFVVEYLAFVAAPKGTISRERALKAQLVLPILFFLVFMLLPSGKKLFVITTLSFTIVLSIGKLFTYTYKDYKVKKTKESQQAAVGEPVLVETKT